MSDTESIMQTSKKKTFLTLCLLVNCTKAGFQIVCPKMSKGFFCLFMFISIEIQVWEKFSIWNFSYYNLLAFYFKSTSRVSQPCRWFLLNSNGGIINIFQLNSPKKNIIFECLLKISVKIILCNWVRGFLLLLMVSFGQ